MQESEHNSGLVRELLQQGAESEWVEFKHNNEDPTLIGRLVSALANGAAIAGKAYGYAVWGIEDSTHAVVGTSFNPNNLIAGNQSLTNWLATQLKPEVYFKFLNETYFGKTLVVLKISRAETNPVKFKGIAYIRVDSSTKPINSHPAIERELWKILQTVSPEELAEVEGVSNEEVLELLDMKSYCRLTNQPLPSDVMEQLSLLVKERMITADGRGGWDVTKYGVLCLAENLVKFGSLSRKAIRVIEYSDHTRLEALKEQDGVKGYAVGFEGLIKYLSGRLPQLEVTDPLRRTAHVYPPVAVRELVANALIHQDLSVTGAGPLIEIFSDRVEISNPGVPLVAIDRFLDTPPRSRNERLASFMRRIGICEERGGGIDKVIHAIEVAQLPAPEFRVNGDNTVVTLFGPRNLSTMARADRTRAVYLHTCLRFVNQKEVTNSTIRERFGMTDASRASRLLKDAVEDGRIRLRDESSGLRYRRYVPYWA